MNEVDMLVTIVNEASPLSRIKQAMVIAFIHGLKASENTMEG